MAGCGNESDRGRDGTARDQVRQDYSQIVSEADPNDSGTGKTGCCDNEATSDRATWVAEALGYDSETLGQLPDDANLGLSCGNPTAVAALQEGQVVLDLGSGAGFDCFVAGPKVGASGRVIGVDMTPEMLAKARSNLDDYQARTGLANVEFRLGEIEHIPAADRSVDVIISNCVINLSPAKAQVWAEVARVLKPDGRVAVSDMALWQPLPESVDDVAGAWSGCIAGAIEMADYRSIVEATGLTDVQIVPRPDHDASIEACEDPLYQQLAEALPPGMALTDYLASVDVTARKPG
ncbi:MAG: arsenite methyltransferase [Candidatus Bipolaricaulia bacterium]